MNIILQKLCCRRLFAFAALLAALATPLACLQVHAQAPTNDMFDARIPLGQATNYLTGTNTYATAESGEWPHRGSPAVRSLWWRWTPPVNGYALVATTNSPSLTRVAVYGGEKVLTQLTPEPLLTNSGLPTIPDRYEFSASQGFDYNIAVDGRSGSSGVIQMAIKLYTSPEILVQPQPPGGTNVVIAGQRANITVGVLGKLPLAYEWQFSTLSRNAGFTNLPAGTSQQLTIGTYGVVTKADEGWYRVIITNDYGSVTNTQTYVLVNECAVPNPPQPAAVVTNVGKTVSFGASALGTQPLNYQWQFRPAGQADFADVLGATATNLVFTNISTDLEGEYRFLVSNVACTNQASASVTLTVTTTNALVLCANLPADATVITNQNTNFSVCVTEGYQPIRYQWWFSPPSGSFTPIVGETAPNLFLPGIQLAQAGYYLYPARTRIAGARFGQY